MGFGMITLAGRYGRAWENLLCPILFRLCQNYYPHGCWSIYKYSIHVLLFSYVCMFKCSGSEILKDSTHDKIIPTFDADCAYA